MVDTRVISVSLRSTKTRTKRHAGFRSGLCTQRSGSNAQAGGRYWDALHVQVKAGDLISIGFWNGAILTSGAGESGNGGSMTLRMSILCADGTRSADYSTTIADNGTGEVQIVAPVDIPAYQRFIMNWDMNMAGSGRVPSIGFSNSCDRGNGDQYLVGAPGYGHTQDSTVLGVGESSVWLPQYTAVLSDRRVKVGVGDSLVAGTNQVAFDPSGGKGLFGPDLAADGPYLNYGAPGDRASVAAAGFTARSALITAAGASSDCPFTAFLQLGRNDVTAGRTADQILTDRATLRATLKAAGCGRVFDTTITPATTDTVSNWATTANQTPTGAASEIVRCNFNDFMRGVRSYGATGTLTGTLTNGSAVVTAVSTLLLFGIFPGMTSTSTTSGIPANTTILSIDYTANTITMSASFTGTTTAASPITGTAPTIAATFPTTSDGLVDVASTIEGAKTLPAGQVRNGGVFMPGLSNDGVHLSATGYAQASAIVGRAARTST